MFVYEYYSFEQCAKDGNPPVFSDVLKSVANKVKNGNATPYDFQRLRPEKRIDASLWGAYTAAAEKALQTRQNSVSKLRWGLPKGLREEKEETGLSRHDLQLLGAKGQFTGTSTVDIRDLVTVSVVVRDKK